MPFSIKWEAQGACISFRGHITALDIHGASKRFFRDPRSNQAAYRIADFTETTSYEIAPTDPIHFSAISFGGSRYLSPHGVAIVSQNPEISEIATQYFEHTVRLGTNWEFRLFEAMEDARAWTELLASEFSIQDTTNRGVPT